jgi:hypothetical protein
LILEFNFLTNILFNAGYIWSDIVMLIVGDPNKTKNDYAYYLGFYVGDLVLRFFFSNNKT